MFTNLFNIKEYAGLFFDGKEIQIIKIEKKGNNFYPTYWNTLNFNLNDLEEKSKMIESFKKIKSNLKTNRININIDYTIKNKKLEIEIVSNLKIAGFDKIQFVNWDYNIENLIIDKSLDEKVIFVFIENNNDLNIFYWDKDHAYRKEKISLEQLNSKKIQDIFQNSNQKHIFLSGYFKNNLSEIKNIFKKENIKIHIFNLWKNISSLDEVIPALFKDKSHEYIKTISITLPPLEEIPFKELIIDNKKIRNKNSQTEENINLDFILDNEKESAIIEEKYTFWQKIKNFFNKSIFGPKTAKNFNLYNSERKKQTKFSIKTKDKKTFLPKPKYQLFLPKIELKNKISKIKITKRKSGEKKEVLPKLKHQLFLPKLKRKSKNGKKRENKIFLKKPNKIIFLPKDKKNNFLTNFFKWLNKPIFEKDKS